MPLQTTYQIEAPNFGQAERHRLQAGTLIALLWTNQKTQAVCTELIRTTGLDHQVVNLRNAIEEQAEANRIQSADLDLFNAIMANGQTIGATMSDHVRNLFGMYVPWIAIQLAGCLVTQLQAFACEKQLSYQSTLTPVAPPSLLPLPMGATWEEAQKGIRRAVKSTMHRGRAPKKIDALIRDVRWYYQHMIEGQSKRKLAKAYMTDIKKQRPPDDESSYDGRGLVITGIRETANRLSLPLPPASK